MIDITLLNTNRTHVLVNEKTVQVATRREGYTVVEGTNTAQITVNYPAEYSSWTKSVIMTNAQGGSIRKELEGRDIEYTFSLPIEMTISPYTKLLFQAVRGVEIQRWTIVDIPIARTAEGQMPAIPSNDAEEIRAIAQSVRDDADAGKFQGPEGPEGPPAKTDAELSKTSENAVQNKVITEAFDLLNLKKVDSVNNRTAVISASDNGINRSDLEIGSGYVGIRVRGDENRPKGQIGIDANSINAFSFEGEINLSGYIDTVIQGRSMNKYFQKLDDLYGSYVKFLTEEKTAYSRDIPANSLPNVMIDKIGGVTHKCKNLLNIADLIGVPQYADGNKYDCFINKPFSLSCFNNNVKSLDPLFYWRFRFQTKSGNFGYVSIENLPTNQAVNTIKSASIRNLENIETDPVIQIATRYGDMEGSLENIMINYGEPLPYEPYYSGLYNATPTAMKINGANLFDTDNYYGDDTYFIQQNVIAYDKKTKEVTLLTPFVAGVSIIQNLIEINSQYLYISMSNVKNLPEERRQQRVNIYDKDNNLIFSTYSYINNTKIDLGAVYNKIKITFMDNGYTYPRKLGTIQIATKPITWEYTPYTPPQTIDLAQLSTLKGFGRGIETDGKLYTNGFDFKTKGYNYQVDEIDLGDLTYKKGGHDNKRWITNGIMQEIQKPNPDKLPVIIADSYNVVAFSNQTNEKDIAINPLGEIFITDTQYTTPDELQQALKGVKLQYLIATPEITEHPEIDIPDMFRAEQNGSVEFINPKKKAVYSQLTFEIKNV